MRLGLSTYTYTWAVGAGMTVFDLLDRAVELGVALVQIADNAPLDGLGKPELDRFDGRARESGIGVEVATRGIGREHVLRQLQIAQLVGSPLVRVVVDTADEHPTPEQVIAELAIHQEAFERAGVVLAIENHDRFDVATLAAIVGELGGWTGICLDTVNSFGSGEGPAAVVGALGPLAVSLHIKDFAVRRADHAMGFAIEGTPAGAGMLDVPWLLGEIARYGRDPNAILELWTPPEPDPISTIRKEAEWARQSVSYLRTLIPG